VQRGAGRGASARVEEIAAAAGVANARRSAGADAGIVCVSEKFEGLSRVKRQQLVMRSIKDEMDSGAIHAIDSLQTKTPAEWSG